MRLALLLAMGACTQGALPGPQLPLAEEPAPAAPEPVAAPEVEPVLEVPVTCEGLEPDDAWMQAFVARHLAALGPPAADPVSHRLQLVVGEVRGAGAQRCVTWHPYRHQAEYVYPASALKPLAAVAALQTVRGRMAEEPALAGLTHDTPLRIEELRAGERTGPVIAEPRRTTLRFEVDEALVKSSNPAFNFLYDVAGQEGLHRRLWDAGLPTVRIEHRLSLGLSAATQRMAPRMVAELDGGEVELVPERRDAAILPAHGLPGHLVGQAHRVGRTREVLQEPLDFSRKNAVSLLDMLRLTAWIADPVLAPDLRLSELTDGDRLLVRDAMARVPWDWAAFHPLRAGLVEAVAGDDLLYVNKGGQAYGFHLDVAYVEQRSTGRAFLVGAALYVNPNGVMNDGVYGYEEISAPFLTALGAALARELLIDPPPGAP